MMLFDDEALRKAVEAMVRNKELVLIEMPPIALFVICATLQMSLTHPDIGPDIKEIAESMAKSFQGKLHELHPELDALVEAGWHRQ